VKKPVDFAEPLTPLPHLNPLDLSQQEADLAVTPPSKVNELLLESPPPVVHGHGKS